MLVWLNTYLNWWESQTEKFVEKFIEMTLFDFLVSIPFVFAPFLFYFGFLVALKKQIN